MLPQPGLRAVNLQKVRLLDRIANHNPGLANEIRNLKLDWYRIKNVVEDEKEDAPEEAESGHAEVYVYDEIGGSFGVGVTDFIDEINAITQPRIVVRINSPGGLLIDAIAMRSALQQHPAHVTTRVDGIAASAASLIATAGDSCEMMDGSQLMIHRVMAGAQGNRADMAEMVEWLDTQDQNIANMYAKRAGNGSTSEEWLARMAAETWMFAEEAVELGLMDSVYVPVKSAFPSKEKPSEDPEKESEEEEPEEEEEESEDGEMKSEEDALDALMRMPHRMTNRGYKYTNRKKAPAPTAHDALIDTFLNKLGRK